MKHKSYHFHISDGYLDAYRALSTPLVRRNARGLRGGSRAKGGAHFRLLAVTGLRDRLANPACRFPCSTLRPGACALNAILAVNRGYHSLTEGAAAATDTDRNRHSPGVEIIIERYGHLC